MNGKYSIGGTPEFPAVSKEFIDKLSEVFPLKKADIKASEREVWAEVGRQDVLDFLRHQYNIQTELSFGVNPLA